VTEETQKITAKARQEAEETRNQILKEASAYKEQVVNEARQKSEEMVSQAERTCEVLKNEIHDRIRQQSTEKACELIQNALPDTFRSQLHTMWMAEAEEAEFNLGRLNLPDEVKEVKLSSAFPLTEKQKHALHEKLTKRFGSRVKITQDVDAKLVAGLVVTIDNVVMDGSLKDRVQRQIENKSK
jgi:vacuolar-type H+-ATPase subunit H